MNDLNMPVQKSIRMEINKNAFDSWYAAIIALMAGGIKFTMLQLNPLSKLDFWEKLIPAVLTAAICTLTGLAMKDIYKWAKVKYFKRKK